MKKVLIIILVLGIAAMAAVSGCTDLTGSLNGASPTPYVVYNPVSPTPTPVPIVPFSPTPGVVVVNSQPSEAISLIIAPVDSKAFTVERGINGQYENFTMFVANDGNEAVKNVNVIVTIGNNAGTSVHYQVFPVGDFAKGERRQVWLVTKEHQDTDFMIVKFKLTWGENGEFYRPQDYEKYLRAFIY